MTLLPSWEYQLNLLNTELEEINETLTELRNKDTSYRAYRDNKIRMLEDEQGYIKMDIERLEKRIAMDQKIAPVTTSKFVTHKYTRKELAEREERYAAEDRQDEIEKLGKEY